MSILSVIKNFIPLGLFYSLRNIKKRKLQISEFSKRPKILYLDAPDYGNLGDQAIALAINKFAEEHFSDFDFYELSYAEYPNYEKFILENITEKDIIFLTGGGNMGNYYRLYEAVRRRIIAKFPKNLIVVFPQTIDYSQNIFGKLSSKKSSKVYSKHSKMILCAREQKSFEIMKDLYGKNTVLLCADVVLTLKPYDFGLERTGLATCLRNDIERALSEEQHEDIIKCLSKYGTVAELTTTYNGKIDKSNREEIIIERLREFSKNKLVVTDRLHGMIFCAITNTPCVAFDNTNKKIKGVYKHLDNNDFVCALEDKTLLEEKTDKLITIRDASFESSDVTQLVEKIKDSYVWKR